MKRLSTSGMSNTRPAMILRVQNVKIYIVHNKKNRIQYLSRRFATQSYVITMSNEQCHNIIRLYRFIIYIYIIHDVCR